MMLPCPIDPSSMHSTTMMVWNSAQGHDLSPESTEQKNVQAGGDGSLEGAVSH